VKRGTRRKPFGVSSSPAKRRDSPSSSRTSYSLAASGGSLRSRVNRPGWRPSSRTSCRPLNGSRARHAQVVTHLDGGVTVKDRCGRDPPNTAEPARQHGEVWTAETDRYRWPWPSQWDTPASSSKDEGPGVDHQDSERVWAAVQPPGGRCSGKPAEWGSGLSSVRRLPIWAPWHTRARRHIRLISSRSESHRRPARSAQGAGS
jgi:hypothetical protein